MKQLLYSFTAIALCVIVSSTSLGTVAENSNRKEPVYEISELVLLMRKMEDQMKTIRGKIAEGKAVEDTLFRDYSGLFTVKASRHIMRDSVYTQLGNDFLKAFGKLTNGKKDPHPVQSYNHTIETCIACHRRYCPGPVMRIGRLKLPE